MSLPRTINVVEIQQDQVLGLTAFEDNADGRQKAEEHFKIVVRENIDDVDDKMMDCFLDQGYVHIEDGSICLVKSEK
jgi:hypothetical protein